VRLDYCGYGDGAVRGVILSKHSESGNWLVHWDGKKKTEQLYGMGSIMKSTVNVARWKQLQSNVDKAEKALENFLDNNRFVPKVDK